MRKFLREHRGFIAFLLFFGLFRTAVADWNPVPTGSMRPTIQEGDVILVDRLAYDAKVPLTDIVLARLGEPARGDVVVFRSPVDGVRLVKRLVAVPGDRVEMREGRLWINDRELDYRELGLASEPHRGNVIAARRFEETTDAKVHLVQWARSWRDPAWDNFGPVVVPSDQYLMLGDNRDNSADSRVFGFVPRHLLTGRSSRILVAVDMHAGWSPRFERWGAPLDPR
jgi:signal peptidase I